MNKLSISVTLLTVVLLAGCSGEEPAVPEPVVRPVRFVVVAGGDAVQERGFSGSAHAGVESRLSFKVAGTVQALPVKVGDTVKKGQTIARLDPTDYQLKVQEAEAALLRSEAEARNAEAGYERVRGLYENRNASRSDLDAARAAAESGAAAVRSVNKQLELARLQLSYTRLAAPADCAVAAVPVEINENVGAGRGVAVVNCGQGLKVTVTMPESLIARVREGDPASVVFDALPGRRFPATVSEVGVAATGTATTFPVTVVLEHSAPELRPGMAAEVRFRFEREGEGVRVPPVAVGEDRQGRFVYVVETVEPGIGIAHRRPVIVGDLSGDGLEVTEGLAIGERVVTAGISRIRDGLRVRLPAPEAP